MWASWSGMKWTLKRAASIYFKIIGIWIIWKTFWRGKTGRFWETHSVDPAEVFSQEDENHFAEADTQPAHVGMYEYFLMSRRCRVMFTVHHSCTGSIVSWSSTMQVRTLLLCFYAHVKVFIFDFHHLNQNWRQFKEGEPMHDVHVCKFVFILQNHDQRIGHLRGGAGVTGKQLVG